MKILPTLVTGGCGFVGRHLVKRLLKNGHEIVLVDNLFSGTHPNEWLEKDDLDKIEFINLDVRDFFRSESEKKFDDVFHLSAVIGGRIKIDKDPISVALDLSIDAEFFNWLVKNKPERVLYTSSSAAYPTSLQAKENQVLLKENMINLEGELGSPDMTYGWSKLTGEYLSKLCAKYYGIHIACVRPFSGYGEDQDLTYPVPAIGMRAVQKEDPLIVWGSGKQSRDFVYIEDCIDAMLLSIEKISDGSGVNISSGKPTTFLEVAQIYATIADYSPSIKPLENMPEGVFARYGDTEMSSKILGWKPKTDLYSGLKIVYDYLKSKTN